MWIQLDKNADLNAVRARIQAMGLWTQSLQNPDGVVGLWVEQHSQSVKSAPILDIPGVASIAQAKSAHPLVDQQRGIAVELPALELAIGVGQTPILITGPCSVDSEAAIYAAAAITETAGAKLLRGGAFKPRSSPYSFAGHGRRALNWIRAAATAHGLGVVTEVMSAHDVDAVCQVADLIQIGSRNMQNFTLLHAVGQAAKPVLLKRGGSATIDEWLLAGEHLFAAGAPSVIFCERGIRSFDTQTRNLLDLSAVALLSQVHGLPVIVDPSHAVGRRDLIVPMAAASLAAGAHGLIVECHPNPEAALSDGPQALSESELGRLAMLLSRSWI
jgi:3-deoxy-7-phosphoheptulonate synthase